MPKPKPKPRYVIFRAEGTTIHDTVGEAVDLARQQQVHEPGVTFWVCQIMVSVESEFHHKVTKHY